MRHLILRRERALACFATKYDCILNRDRQEFLDWLAGQDLQRLMVQGVGTPLRNGETVTLDIGEEGATFFVAACLEKRALVTDTAEIPAGDQDVHYVVRTDYDGYRRLQLTLERE